MAATNKDNIIFYGTAGDTFQEKVLVNAIVFTCSGVSEAVVVKDGNGFNTLFTVDVASTASVVITFGKPQYFPFGLEMDTSTNASMTVFLA